MKSQSRLCSLSNMVSETEQASTLLKILSNPDRLMLTRRLLADGEKTRFDLNGETGLSLSAIDRHLQILRLAGIINVRHAQGRALYSLFHQLAREIILILFPDDPALEHNPEVELLRSSMGVLSE